MKWFTLPGTVLGGILIAMLHAAPAQAQATRTWVSGVGDDANPCSRTAPCKTFAGAITKTSLGGEIDCLDPGGFGAVTITKSITIDGGEGQVASVLVSGTNGIVVAAGATDVVKLRNLSIQGLAPGSGPGVAGIRFQSGAALHLEHVNVMNFSPNGIQFATNQASLLHVSDSTFSNNVGGGVLIAPVSGGSVKAALERVLINGNGAYGLRVDGTTAGSVALTVAVSDSQIANNATNGVLGVSGPGSVFVVVNRSTIVNNGTNGLRSDQSLGSTSFVAVGSSTISGNETAADAVGGASLVTYGNNEVNGNTISNGTFTAVQALQ